MFAKRTNWNLTPNRLSEALAAHRSTGSASDSSWCVLQTFLKPHHYRGTTIFVVARLQTRALFLDIGAPTRSGPISQFCNQSSPEGKTQMTYTKRSAKP